MARILQGDMGNEVMGFLPTNNLARLAGTSQLHKTVTRPAQILFIDREDIFSKIWTGVQHVVLQRTDEFIPQDEHASHIEVQQLLLLLIVSHIEVQQRMPLNPACSVPL